MSGNINIKEQVRLLWGLTSIYEIRGQSARVQFHRMWTFLRTQLASLILAPHNLVRMLCKYEKQHLRFGTRSPWILTQLNVEDKWNVNRTGIDCSGNKAPDSWWGKRTHKDLETEKKSKTKNNWHGCIPFQLIWQKFISRGNLACLLAIRECEAMYAVNGWRS